MESFQGSCHLAYEDIYKNKSPTLRPYLISRSPPEISPFALGEVNDLNGKISKDRPIAGGNFSDVYMGYYVTGTTPTKVAIKELRCHIYSQESRAKLEKRLRREVRIWGNLDHPNIVSLLGVTYDFGTCPAMVYEWMSQGTLFQYLQKEKENLGFESRMNICKSIADGLAYLHSQKVVHGDLTPANILMDNNVVHLSDFGLSNVITELQGPAFFTSKAGCSARWIAPELLQVSDADNIAPELTTSSDVYSFASVAFYVITGTLPYEHLRHEFQIIAHMLRSCNICPPRPAQSLLTDECWEILTMCWAPDPTQRLDINDARQHLKQLLPLPDSNRS